MRSALTPADGADRTAIPALVATCPHYDRPGRAGETTGPRPRCVDMAISELIALTAAVWLVCSSICLLVLAAIYVAERSGGRRASSPRRSAELARPALVVLSPRRIDGT